MKKSVGRSGARAIVRLTYMQTHYVTVNLITGLEMTLARCVPDNSTKSVHRI